MNPVTGDHDCLEGRGWSGQQRAGGYDGGGGTNLSRAVVTLAAASTVALTTEDPIEAIGTGTKQARSAGWAVLVLIRNFLNAPMLAVAPSFSTGTRLYGASPRHCIGRGQTR